MEPEAYEELDQLESTHWWYEGMRRITHAILRRHVSDQPLTILDAGCGAGGNLQALSRYGCVYGVDYSPLALQYAKHR
jgi:SAM-dependent methyltransferase